jgi:hypothetical protein
MITPRKTVVHADRLDQALGTVQVCRADVPVPLVDYTTAQLRAWRITEWLRPDMRAAIAAASARYVGDRPAAAHRN